MSSKPVPSSGALSGVAQRISVALHRAAALEILQSLRMGPVEGRDLY